MSRVRAPSPALRQDDTGSSEVNTAARCLAAVFGMKAGRARSALAGTVARVAQLVEHTLGKGEVIGSIPIASSGRTLVVARRKRTSFLPGTLNRYGQGKV